MRRWTRIFVLLAVVSLVGISCDNFKQISTQVTVDTGNQLSLSFDINATISQALGNTVIYVDPSGNKYTYSQFIKKFSNFCNLPIPVKFSIMAPIPLIPVPSSLFDQIKPYCGGMDGGCQKLYGVNISRIEYTFSNMNIPVTIAKSLLVITDSSSTQNITSWQDANVNAVAISFIPEISSATPTNQVIEGEFAPGGEDAASDIIRSFNFSFGIALPVSVGDGGSGDGGAGDVKYSLPGFNITIDSTNPANCQFPTGIITILIRVWMTFQVAPLA